MTTREGRDEPINVEGMKFLEVEEIVVNEYHELPDGKGDPTQVHLWLRLVNFPHPLIVRFRSRRPVDELIVALMTHSKAVWPG